MQKGQGQFTLIVNFLNLNFTLIVNFLNLNFLNFKIQARHNLWLSFKFWLIAICLWGILIKNLLTWPYLFSESLLLPCFLPVSDVTLIGDWFSLTEDRDNSLSGYLCCSLAGDTFSLTGVVGLFIGDVTFLCFLWDWWELYLPFLLFVARKCTLLSWKWLYSSSDGDSYGEIWESEGEQIFEEYLVFLV